jgi:ribonucleotide monophosphatase NagD (HAD superfamily)
VSDELVDGYDLIIFDLDGVVYLGEQAIACAPEALAELHGRGKPRAYATNNASRRAAEVAALLTALGVLAEPDEVTTAAQASATVLAGRLPAGSPVLVVGAQALQDEVAEVGLRPVRSATDNPVAVVQGYGPKGRAGSRRTPTVRCRHRGDRCPATARWSPPSPPRSTAVPT